ncbi:MBL fold metallo-hydrolase [Pseudalkalibacillus sp. R45]|uniref:MBL fold metallo-hydrolase n=1 Tax=Pseudalkalibacillus sp. R45 TaxID=3457433 RepID=UPI003FCE221A
MKHSVYRKGESLHEQINQTKVPSEALAIWHLGQESAVIKGTSDRILYFDPYFSNSIEESGGFSRNFEPPLKPEEVTNADYVFITHHHLDHLDPNTLVPLSESSPRAKFVIPRAHLKYVERLGINRSRIIPMNSGETEVLDELKIIALPGKHEEFAMDSEGNHYYLGYIVELDGICFYHAGDTIIYPELIQEVKKYKIDAAYLPINGRDYFRTEKGIIGNMNYREAIEFSVEINVDLMLPCHYDLMDENFENPSYFVDYLFKHYRNQKFKMMVPGERMLYLKEY